MRFDIITLFPELFEPFLITGVTRRAFENAGTKGAQLDAPLSPQPKPLTGADANAQARSSPPLVDVRLWNPRDFAPGNYRRVDDRPFGGGPGMVMMAQPLADCVAAIAQSRGHQAPVLLFSPTGQVLTHAQVQSWASSQGAVLLCGRYEGVDQRFIDAHVTHQLSLGDFVLSGGEIPAMALLDAVARLQPGVLGDEQSAPQDSFNPALGGLLDCPHYTRPEVWQGQAVPEVLLSGNHAAIERWRGEQRRSLTARLRPDLLEKPVKNRL